MLCLRQKAFYRQGLQDQENGIQEGMSMALEFLFSPLLSLNPALSVLVFSVIILILINIFYKVLVNQAVAKDIKDRQKEFSRRMKEERKAGNTDKMNTLMKESLAENSKLMRMTMKPMIVSFIIVIIFLPWLAAVYGDVTAPMQNSTGVVTLKGINHTFSVKDGEISVEGGVNFKELSSGSQSCDNACFVIDNRKYEAYQDKNSIKFAPIVATFPFMLPVFGYTAGWLGWYLIVSIPLVVIIRKLMKIYV
jgi:uncharacterized membrane protein (DUF106 family)